MYQENINFFLHLDLIYNFLVYHLKMIEPKKTYFINGKSFVCEIKEPYLEELIETFLNVKVKEKSNIAVAVNNVLVQRRKWKKKKIFLNDKIDIVAPFFGG